MNKPRKKRKKIHSNNKENRWHELSDHVNRSNKPKLHFDNINKGVLSDSFALRQYWAHISKNALEVVINYLHLIICPL